MHSNSFTFVPFTGDHGDCGNWGIAYHRLTKLPLIGFIENTYLQHVFIEIKPEWYKDVHQTYHYDYLRDFLELDENTKYLCYVDEFFIKKKLKHSKEKYIQKWIEKMQKNLPS